MPQTTTKRNKPRLFEEARDAIVKLDAISRLLSRTEIETLEILLDKHAMALIEKSLEEADRGKYVPITSIR